MKYESVSDFIQEKYSDSIAELDEVESSTIKLKKRRNELGRGP